MLTPAMPSSPGTSKLLKFLESYVVSIVEQPEFLQTGKEGASEVWVPQETDNYSVHPHMCCPPASGSSRGVPAKS